MLSLIKLGRVPANAWQLILALAHIAVFRNIALTVLIMVLSVGITALVMWHHGGNSTQPQPPAARQPSAPGPNNKLPQHGLDTSRPDFTGQPESEGTKVTVFTEYHMPDPITYPGLYVEVNIKYACGHEGRFRPADEGQLAWEYPGAFLRMLEDQACAECQSIAEYQRQQAQKEQRTR